MKVPLHLIDAFAHERFTGNPAAICLLTEPAEAGWMQEVAMEMNQAETAFLVSQDGGFSLRWFTPTVEVDLCGHATLASAHFLFTGGHANGTVRFFTKSGTLTAARVSEEIELDFPSEAPVEAELPAAQSWLNGQEVWTGANRMDWFIQVRSEDDVRALKPDFAEIARLGQRGVVVTGPGDGQYDFVSRCFFPNSGILEDPVTGSAHCALAPYWASKLGRSRMTGYQASQRGGVVNVELAGERVKLKGRAVTTVAGWLLGDDVPVA